MVDAIKALASQLIVWHHLVFYGPMSDVVYPYATGVMNWLYDQARVAVQAFLVVAGFLAARSLLARVESADLHPPRMIWRRYTRLAGPYLVALAAALVSGAVARRLIQHPDVPTAPSLAQTISHVFLLENILGFEGLSAGVWYVAIDLQLYALLVLLLWLARKLAGATGSRVSPAAWLLVAGMTIASLFWLNREPGLDVWAVYFFGAYGLGIMAHGISIQPRKHLWIAALALVVCAALFVEWRSRILLAGLTAITLACSTQYSTQWATPRLVTWLSHISYSVFLIHYPVCLLVGAIVFRLWPESAAANAAGMVLAWLCSVGAGGILYRTVEARAARWAVLR